MQRNQGESKQVNSELKNVVAEPTALELHARFFANKEGKFTAESIKTKLESLGGEAAASANTVGTGTVHIAYRNGCPYAKFFGGGYFESADLPKLIHPCDTGIFDEKGNLNEALFNKLASRAMDDKESGKKLLSREMILEFKQNDGHPAKKKKCGDTLLGYFASGGEFKLLFESLSDVEKNNVKYISVERLRQFYENSQPLFEEVAARREIESKLKQESVGKPESAPINYTVSMSRK